MNRIAGLIFLFLVIGCNSGNDLPNGILPPKKMQYVMWDMIVADGLSSYSYDSLMRKPGRRMELYNTVLSTHKLSQEDFRKSMKYYEARPDLLKLVLDSLQQMALRDTSRIIQDTLKVKTDTIKTSLDTTKTKRISIDRLKAIKKVKPV